MSELLRAKIPFACPQCGRRIEATLGQFQSGVTIWCPGGHSVRVGSKDNGIRQADQALDRFKRSMQRLNRRLK
jgi:hypothetical protein